MKIPKKINPCPIIEAIVEIRMDTNIPGEAIFGVVYNTFKNDFPHVEKLPILQIPEQFRSSDPNLKYKPYYQLKNDNILLQVGSNVFSLVNVGEYIGWTEFSKIISDVFTELLDKVEIKNIRRIATRYVNMFRNMNIFDNLNLKIKLSDKDFSDNEVNLISNIVQRNCVSRLTIANRANVSIDGQAHAGSVIDIDTVIKDCPVGVEKDVELFMSCINVAHTEEKELFFELLNEEYLNALNPKY